MRFDKSRVLTMVLMLAVLDAVPSAVFAQVGKSLGVVDANTATEPELADDAAHDAGDREGPDRQAAVHERHRAEHVSARPEADAGTGQ